MDVVKVTLRNGMVSLVDAEDWESPKTFHRVNGMTASVVPSSINWRAVKNRHFWYATNQKQFNGVRFVLTLHRLVMECPPHLIVDHIGDTLDNRKCMLRFATKATNAAHEVTKRGGTSQYRGVWKSPKPLSRPWVAQIGITLAGHKRHITIGQYHTEESAARAYDEAAIRLFGEFAVLNFPPEVAAQ